MPSPITKWTSSKGVLNRKRLFLSYRTQNGINDLDSDIWFNTISFWDMYDHGTPCIVIFRLFDSFINQCCIVIAFFLTRGLSFLPETAVAIHIWLVCYARCLKSGTCLWFIFSNPIFTAFWTSWASFWQKQQL